MKSYSSTQLNLEKEMQRNYLLQRCEHCKKGMLLAPGSIICGDRWYHNNCYGCISNYKNGSHQSELEVHEEKLK